MFINGWFQELIYLDLHNQNEKTYALTDCVFDPILQTNLYFSMISGTEVQFLPAFMMWTPRNMTLSSSISSHCPHQSLRNRSDGVPVKTCPSVYLATQGQCFFYFFLFQRSTFVSSAQSFGFFIPATTANDLRLRRIFYPRFYPLHLFSVLNS